MAKVTAYAALLRGINVGGARKVPMVALRALAERMGLADVATYIASGNLLFRSATAAAELTELLHRELKDEFGFDVDVVVVSDVDLKRAIDENPFPEGDPKQVNVTFLSAPYDAAARETLKELATDEERIEFGGARSRWLFVDFAGGLARSKLASKLHSVSKTGYATTRNIRTVQTISERLAALSATE